jgi:sugar lactone lactonase YvrE
MTAGFLNDVAAAGGAVYVSDSRAGIIYRFRDGAFDVFIPEGQLSDPNGLHIYDGTLYVGNSGDGTVRAVDLADGSMRTFASLGPGIIDGIESDGGGNLLVSHWEGRLYRITPDGSVSRILDTTSPGVNIANFGSSDSVVSYSLPR